MSCPESKKIILDDFDKAMAFVLKWEGGSVDDPNDRGGKTHFGISERANQAKYPEFFQNPSLGAAKEIYRREYWREHRLNDLKWPINLIVFDSEVQHPYRWGVQNLQRVLRVKPDGIIGPVTIGAVDKHELKNILIPFMARRAAFYAEQVVNVPSQGKFLQGWMNRLMDLFWVAATS